MPKLFAIFCRFGAETVTQKVKHNEVQLKTYWRIVELFSRRRRRLVSAQLSNKFI